MYVCGKGHVDLPQMEICTAPFNERFVQGPPAVSGNESDANMLDHFDFPTPITAALLRTFKGSHTPNWRQEQVAMAEPPAVSPHIS